MKRQNGVDVSLNQTVATGDPTRVAEVNRSLDARIPRMLGGDHLNMQPRMTGTATGKDPTGRYRTRDALDRKLDATKADSETTQAEKSFAKKEKRKGAKWWKPREEKHVLAGCEDTHARSGAAGDTRHCTQKSSG